MTDSANTLSNNGLSALIKQAAPHVLDAIKKASAATGVDFAYMVQKASTESGFDAKAKSASSSATGLYQFIDKTWLSMVKKYGPSCGLGKYADCIDAKGNVANPAVKQQILALRKDPDTAAMMAAEYTSENKDYMQQQLGSGTKIGATELNLAHFLGAGGATSFLKAYQENPLQQASDLFPKAANVNRGIFYDSKTGTPRTLAGVYDLFAKKAGETPSITAPATVAVANATTTIQDTASTSDTTTDSRKLLAQTLMSQISSEQAALHPDTATSSSNAPISPVESGATTYLASTKETIHWFARPTKTYNDTMQQAASNQSNGVPAGLVGNPVDVMMMAQSTDRALSRSNQKYAAYNDYSRLNS